MAVFDLLAEGRTPRKYRAGQLIYLQGARPDRFYYLIAGSVRSFISTASGEERVLTVHRAGDLMGEAAFFDGFPRATSATALEDCLVLPVDRVQLDRAFQRHPELALPMLEYLAKTVRLLSAHVDSASLPAPQRVVRHLLAQPREENGTVRCTHESIGQAVGLSRVTVSRVLGRLAQGGLIRPGYRSVTLLRPDRLEELSQED